MKTALTKTSLSLAALAALCLAAPAGQAYAAAKCNLTGNWTDDYGATATITGKKGTMTFLALCGTPYALKITDLTKTGFDVTGTNTNKSCGTFAVDLTFQGSCTVASGSITVDGFKVNDTWINHGAFGPCARPAHRPHHRPALTIPIGRIKNPPYPPRATMTFIDRSEKRPTDLTMLFIEPAAPDALIVATMLWVFASLVPVLSDLHLNSPHETTDW